MARPRFVSPTDTFPYPGHTERRTSFLLRWSQSPRVKREFGHRARQEGLKAWEAARLDSVVSVKTEEDQFLVFDGGY